MSEWSDYLEAMRAAGERVLAKLPSNDEQVRAETLQMLLATFTRGFLAAAGSDPSYPVFTPELNPALNFLAPNADTVYQSTPVDSKGSYRIRGNRGGVRLFTLTQATGVAPTKGDLDLDAVPRDTLGNFEVLVGPERPAGHQGHWWQLQSGTLFLMTRQVSYAWGEEASPHLTIERLDVPAARPRPTKELLMQRLQACIVMMERYTAAFLGHVPKLAEQGLINRVKFVDYSHAAGLTGQYYYEGIFDLQDDEALIVEAKPPQECRYYSILLADDIFATLDWVNRQSSLNGAQARLDADGVFRAVIAKRDPGVPNWLDTVDRNRAALQGRFTHCGSSVPTEPTAKKVPLAELRKHLPAETPTVSPGEREQQLRRRRESWQRRRLW